MKSILLIIALISLSACNGKFDAKKLDLRKDCTGNETNKTLSDVFCKKNPKHLLLILRLDVLKPLPL